jgi:hypothetical protein
MLYIIHVYVAYLVSDTRVRYDVLCMLQVQCACYYTVHYDVLCMLQV